MVRLGTSLHDGVHMYHLSVGICENGYQFEQMPTNKW